MKKFFTNIFDWFQTLDVKLYNKRLERFVGRVNSVSEAEYKIREFEKKEREMNLFSYRPWPL